MRDGIDVSDLRELASSLNRIGGSLVRPMAEVYDHAGEILRDQWRENARRTSGRHGKHYPKSITSERKVSLDIVVEVGPDKALPQGSMAKGFEFGSVNQPAHLDGQKATDKLEPVLGKMVELALRDLGL